MAEQILDNIVVLNGTPETPPTETVKKSPFDADFEDVIKRALEEWHTPGMSVAVIDGEETWSKGYGFATLPDTPVKPSSLFYAGSTTKSFLAAAVSLLVHDKEKYNHIKWETPINQLIRDDFVLEDDYATSHVTIEDALSHRSGLPGHTLTFGGSTPKEAARSLRHLFLSKEPRTTWQYSNIMYIAVSHMVEAVTGGWLGDFLKQRIWEPLNMSQTFFRLEDAQEYVKANTDGNLANGYFWDKSSTTAKEVPHWNDPVTSGAGAIISNALDYAKYIRSMIDQSGPLPPEAYADLINPRVIVPPFDPHFKHTLLYSLGWFIGVYHGEKVIWHGGGLDGFSTAMLYLPDRKWGVTVFANGQSRGPEVPAWYLIDTLLNVPKAERLNLFEWNESALAQQKQANTEPRSRLYPSIPTPPSSLPLPLSAYTGTYMHPAYRAFTIIEVQDSEHTLQATAEGELRTVLQLSHVSEEYFLAGLVLFTHGTEPVTTLRAEFKHDIEGKVSEFGAELEFLSGSEKKIWFKKEA